MSGSPRESNPDVPTPHGDYAVARLASDLIFTAGMTPRLDGAMIESGRVGSEVTPARARELAGIAARRAVAAAQAVGRSAGRTLTDAVSLTVYVRTTAEFTDHSYVADGATEAIGKALGGLAPARAAVGLYSLPGGAAVEVAAVFGTSTVARDQPAYASHTPAT
ncbi:RidA family protein [Saccharopolyspora spinosa]|uniref:RidA family protein n=1 Tax=Saccharopolyspora spinosa TaxID=60894 RepID=UPI003BACC066